MFGLRLGKLGAAIRAGTGSAGVTPLFSRNFEATGSLGADATFTRASTATVTDFEGLIKTTKSGEARFDGLRRVENLCNEALSSTEDITTWRGTATRIDAETVSFSAFQYLYLGDKSQGTTTINGNVYRLSVDIKLGTGTGNFTLYHFNAVEGDDSSITITSDWKRFSAQVTADGTDIRFGVRSFGGTGTLKVKNILVENVTGQTNQNPSEYVSVGVLSAPYHGANVDGVKYFATENGNTVSSNVVTEGTGAAITGGALLMEPAAANGIQNSTDMSISAPNWYDYTSGRITVTNTTTQAPDGTNYWALECATDAGISTYYTTSNVFTKDAVAQTWTCTCLIKGGVAPWAAISVANNNASKQVIVWLNLATGAAGISQVETIWTLDNFEIKEQQTGVYKCAVTITTDTDTSIRMSVRACSADAVWTINPSSVGDHLVLMAMAQLELGSVPTSYIPTSGSTVTRAADALSYSGIAADNETRAITDAGTVDVDDWDGVVDATINGADNLAQISSITVYTTGERPA